MSDLSLTCHDDIGKYKEDMRTRWPTRCGTLCPRSITHNRELGQLKDQNHDVNVIVDVAKGGSWGSIGLSIK